MEDAMKKKHKAYGGKSLTSVRLDKELRAAVKASGQTYAYLISLGLKTHDRSLPLLDRLASQDKVLAGVESRVNHWYAHLDRVEVKVDRLAFIGEELKKVRDELELLKKNWKF